jgi:hypothetical protein
LGRIVPRRRPCAERYIGAEDKTRTAMKKMEEQPFARRVGKKTEKKTTSFRPPDLNDYQNAADIASRSPRRADV